MSSVTLMYMCLSLASNSDEDEEDCDDDVMVGTGTLEVVREANQSVGDATSPMECGDTTTASAGTPSPNCHAVDDEAVWRMAILKHLPEGFSFGSEPHVDAEAEMGRCNRDGGSDGSDLSDTTFEDECSGDEEGRRAGGLSRLCGCIFCCCWKRKRKYAEGGHCDSGEEEEEESEAMSSEIDDKAEKENECSEDNNSGRVDAVNRGRNQQPLPASRKAPFRRKNISDVPEQ
eukprot:GHVS01077591.1.p1 GENE.GHVS01077591.1~~GHVS01077591.1.p1  ORF type:complete len:231 (-),score=52.94 GHVS01077591.1:317-1009(-)